MRAGRLRRRYGLARVNIHAFVDLAVGADAMSLGFPTQAVPHLLKYR